MDIKQKFSAAIRNLKPAEHLVNVKTPETEEEFNANVKWITGGDEFDNAIYAEGNPHEELTWILVKAEMDRLQVEYDAQDYARKREAEYPSVQDLVVALYDTDDKAAIDAKRAEIKLKYPKPVA